MGTLVILSCYAHICQLPLGPAHQNLELSTRAPLSKVTVPFNSKELLHPFLSLTETVNEPNDDKLCTTSPAPHDNSRNSQVPDSRSPVRIAFLSCLLNLSHSVSFRVYVVCYSMCWWAYPKEGFHPRAICHVLRCTRPSLSLFILT